MFWDKTLNKKSSVWLLVPLAGIVLEFGFELFEHAKYGFVFAAIPLLVFLYYCKNAKSAFFGGWLAGFIFFAATLRWLLAVFPLYWIGVDNDYYGIAIVGGIWVLSSLSFALGIALFSLFFHLFKKNTWIDVFIAPSLWIIFEYARSYFFEAIWWSKDTAFGPYWTNGSLGYLFIDWPFAKIAKITGLYGLSFFVVFLNAVVLLIFLKKLRKKTAQNKGKIIILAVKIIIVIFLVFFVLSPKVIGYKSVGQKETEVEKIYVSALQLNSKSYFYTSDLMALFKKEETELKKYPEIPHLIIFPEDSQLLAVVGFREKVILENLSASPENSLIVTNALKEKKTTVIFKNGAGKTLAEQQKRVLMPFGEYLPLVVQKTMSILNARETIKNFNELRRVTMGTKKEAPFLNEIFKIGVSSCTGILSTTFYRDMTKNGAELLINQASYELFKGDEHSFSQIMTASRMRAIENDRYFVQSSSSAVSFIADNNGNIIKRGQSGKDTFVNETIYLRSNKNFFVRYGNWIVILAMFFFLLNIFEFVIIESRKN